MTPERWQRIEALLDGALDLPAERRDAYLRAECGPDRDLLAEVRDLLERGEQTNDVLDTPAGAFAAELVDVVERAPGRAVAPMPERIGPWRLVREVGRGGMGTVYLAERDEHFQQRIALKLIRRGLHIDGQLIRRFIDERQILATLEHGNIARLLDGGLTTDGAPWFGMEFVEGEPIDQWCDSRRLGVEARLALFCTVCDAVAYAHDRQIVHRDLKPSNVLVRADGVVKLLDFGIAKLLAPDRTEERLTETGQRPLTPEYASPEQLRGEAATPASDVYSLGVMLHELLTGHRPHRPTPPGLVGKRATGSLDGIVDRALAGDPRERYPTVKALADDVRRHLDGLPVTTPWRVGPRARLAIGVGAVLATVGVGIALWARSAPNEEASALGDGPVIAVGLIADYRGSGKPELARPLADLLGTNLARVPTLRIVSTVRLYELMAQLGTAGSTDAGAYGTAARRAGATMLIDGSLFATGDSVLRLDLRSIDIASGSVLAAQTVSGNDVFALVDSGTAMLAARIGARAPSGSVADVTTRSEVALRFYEEGLRAYSRGDVRAARDLFRTAVGEDSTFAMASLYLARASGRPGTGRLHLERARRFGTRASDRERLIIEAYARLAFSDPGALAYAETLAVRYPHEPDGEVVAGRALAEAGDHLGALARLRRAVAMDSVALRGAEQRCGLCDARADVIAAYVSLDSSAPAVREARAWADLEPNRALSWMTLSTVLRWTGRLDEARAAYRRATEIDPALRGSPLYYSFFIHTGDFETADRALHEIAQTGSPQLQGEAHWFLAISLRNQGRFREALESARRNRALHVQLNPDVPPVQFALPEAHTLFELGRNAESIALFDSVPLGYAEWPASTRARYGTWAHGLAANPLAKLNDTTRLLARMDSVRQLGEGSLMARDRRMHHYLRGLLLVARLDDESAVAEFRRALFTRVGGYTRVNYELAKTLLRLKRPSEAVAILRPTFFDLESSGLYITHTELRDLLAQAWDAAGVADSAIAQYRAVQHAWRRADSPAMRDRANAAASRIQQLQRAP